MTKCHKFMCVCETCIFTNILDVPFLLCTKQMMDKFKTKIELSSNRRSGNLAHTQYITYTEKVMNST